MKQYKVTYKVDIGDENCVLDPNDPLYKMKEQMFLGGIPGIETDLVYPEDDGYDRPRNPYSKV